MVLDCERWVDGCSPNCSDIKLWVGDGARGVVSNACGLAAVPVGFEEVNGGRGGVIIVERNGGGIGGEDKGGANGRGEVVLSYVSVLGLASNLGEASCMYALVRSASGLSSQASLVSTCSTRSALCDGARTQDSLAFSSDQALYSCDHALSFSCDHFLSFCDHAFSCAHTLYSCDHAGSLDRNGETG
jgi:hypothetical protein